jgi:multisubunit Na+/H+ antiporter MnhG subunit
VLIKLGKSIVMKTILRKLFVLILVMSLGAPMHTTMLYAAPAQEMTAAQKAKAKEQAKKQKEREKAAAQKQKPRASILNIFF